MIPKKLHQHLANNKIKYQVIAHRKVYTAYDAAATMHVKLDQIAKSLLVKFNKPFINNQKPYALTVLGADKNIDLLKLKKIVSAWAVKKNKNLRLEASRRGVLDIYNKVAKVAIPKEKDLQDKLKIRPGTASAFGSLYKLPVFIDREFLKQTQAIFSSGSFTDSLKLPIKSFVKLEGALEGNFAVVKRTKKQKKQQTRK